MTSSLNQIDAQRRWSSFEEGINYSVFLNLKLKERYSGIVQIDFTLKNKTNVFVDYFGQTLQSVQINQSDISGEEIKTYLDGTKLNVPESKLVVGKNKLTIVFENDYSKDGNGLHSFTDTDGKQYIYTQTEPFNANRVFPCFDQPDLKGKLSFRAASPKELTVIAINPGTETKFTDFLAQKDDNCFSDVIRTNSKNDVHCESTKYYHFETTDNLSTYLYGFAAGPYRRIVLDLKDSVENIPMSLYMRDSLYDFAFAQQESIFTFTVEGIRFYNQMFKIKYPFKKVDMVFCPEYTVGAMEYPGVITFNDRYIFREIPNVLRITRRGETIVHELAHMWFGNLVTMKWWNDLWLNESFVLQTSEIRTRLD